MVVDVMIITIAILSEYTVVWEKFNVKNFSSLVRHDKKHEIFLTMNKKVKVIFRFSIKSNRDGLVAVYLVYTKPSCPTFES